MLKNYGATIRASFVGYVVQAMVNLFAPLLFVTFQNQYGIPLTQITALITVNFSLQLCVDLFSAVLVERIGYRVSVILAHTVKSASKTIGASALSDIAAGLESAADAGDLPVLQMEHRRFLEKFSATASAIGSVIPLAGEQTADEETLEFPPE